MLSLTVWFGHGHGHGHGGLASSGPTASCRTVLQLRLNGYPIGRFPTCAGELRVARKSHRARARSAVEPVMHQSGRQHLLATSACQAPALSPKWEAAPAGDLSALGFRQNRLNPARFKSSGAVPLWSGAERHGKPTPSSAPRLRRYRPPAPGSHSGASCLRQAGARALHSGVGRGRSLGPAELPVCPHTSREALPTPNSVADLPR